MRPEIEGGSTKSTELRPEVLQTKERREINFSAITISGKSGTGKTATAEMLADMLGITKFKKTGERFRELTSTGGGNSYTDRPIEIDLELDAWQEEQLDDASPDSPLILEGRLAAEVAANREGVIRLLFTAPTDVRMHRILHRFNGQKDIQISRQLGLIEMAQDQDLPAEIVSPLYDELAKLEAEKKTLKTIKKEERGRELGDLEQWKKIHPELEGRDPFDPQNPAGTYDLVVPTGKLTIAQVANRINTWLEKNDFVMVRAEKLSSPQKDVAFPGGGIPEAAELVGAEPPQTLEDVESIAKELDEKISEINASGMEHGEPVSSRSYEEDQHPNHPSRQNHGQESVA